MLLEEGVCYDQCIFLSNTRTMNSLTFKLVLEKAEEPEIKLPTSAGSWKKQALQETQEMCVQSLVWEDPLEEKMAMHPSILSWKIP